MAPRPATRANDEGPRLQADQYEYDFGESDPGPTLQREFVLENKSTKDVQIKRLATTVEQLKAELRDAAGKSVMTLDAPKAPYVLKPGDKATLGLTLDTKSLNGNVRRKAMVFSDDPAREVLTLSLSVKIRGAAPAAAPQVEGAPPQANKDPALEGLSEEDLKGPPPKLEMNEYEVDFGDSLQGELLKRTLKIKNTGEGPLKIVKFQSTCGCTVPRITTKSGEVNQVEINSGRSKAVVEPGDEASLDIEFNSKGMVGEVRREVRIYSNDRTKNPLVIPVKARPQKPYELNPEQLRFGLVMRRHKATLGTRLVASKLPNFDITGIDTPAPFIVATWKREVPAAAGASPPAGGTGGGGQGGAPAPGAGNGTPPAGATPATAFDIEVTITEEAPLGTLMKPIVIKTNHDKLKEISVPIFVSVTSEVTFDTGDPNSPDKLDFGLIDGNKETTREIEIKNDNRAVPYRISKIELLGKYSDHVKQELVTLDDGLKYRLKITMLPGLDARYFRGIVRLTSDHPDLPTKDVTFQGWMKK
ncbi:MAG: DUF1573 domain-containing protein [Planctomycetota bacterium]